MPKVWILCFPTRRWYVAHGGGSTNSYAATAMFLDRREAETHLHRLKVACFPDDPRFYDGVTPVEISIADMRAQMW